MSPYRRPFYFGIRAGMLAGAVAAVALQAHFFRRIGPTGWATLLVSFALLVTLHRISSPILAVAYQRRRSMEQHLLTLELPLMLTLFTVYGWQAPAALALVSYPFSVAPEGRARLLRRFLDGGAEALLWIALGTIAPLVLTRHPALSAPAFALFVAFYLAALFAFFFLVWLPLHALSRRSLSVVRLWRGLLRDTRLLAFALLTISWGFVCTTIWQRAGAALGMAAFTPLPFLAFALRSVNNYRSEVHRLRLARDAVQAMLRTRDPLPQMNSLLSSLHTPAAEETLQIYASMSPGDAHLAPLATLGPVPDAVQIDGVRRVLAQLQRGEESSASQRTDIWSVTGYAARAPDEQLLGALVVHRPARTASLLPARRFVQAASELAALLRDFRTIAATQKAATLDALTGLPNRRSIMLDLRAQIEQLSVGNPCAVLILDIDHFKMINDAMGHQTGDKCLRAVGKIIGSHIRVHDRAGRIGGEEFVVMMPDTTSEMALAVGERLRNAVETGELYYADGRPLTASIGVAVASVSDTVDSLLARADRALYQAKRTGRNRVIELGA